jgi:hypothetical protein
MINYNRSSSAKAFEGGDPKNQEQQPNIDRKEGKV